MRAQQGKQTAQGLGFRVYRTWGLAFMGFIGFGVCRVLGENSTCLKAHSESPVERFVYSQEPKPHPVYPKP